jgi:hypothetical protein
MDEVYQVYDNNELLKTFADYDDAERYRDELEEEAKWDDEYIWIAIEEVF